MQKFFETLATKQELTSYGEKEVLKCLEMGAVETLLISESVSDKKIEQLETLAQQFKGKVEIISTETREGVQLKDIGKIAAILRYPVQQ